MATLKHAYHIIWLLLTVLALDVKCNESAGDLLPHPCYNVKCPPMSEMTCPPDSSVRETLNSIDVQQLTAAPTAVADAMMYNTTEIDEDVYAECCLSKKCLCKTCYIPDCHGEDEVVVELSPESMNKPGQCCGEYECQRKPKCNVDSANQSAPSDRELYWLKGCQRCHCFAGKPMCIQICDEAVNKTKAICKPEKLNALFEHGESWRVGCYECECIDGIEKCVLPFCSNVDCPRERQVTLKDGCCPICWPGCAPMPKELLSGRNSFHGKYGSASRHYDDEDIDEDGLTDDFVDDTNSAARNLDYAGENEIDPLTDLQLGEAEAVQPQHNTTAEVQTTTNAVISSTTAATTTAKSTASPAAIQSSSTTLAPAAYLPLTPSTAAPAEASAVALASEPAIATACPPASASRRDSPASFQLYPDEDDVMPAVKAAPESCKHWMIYIVIGILVAFIAVLIAWIIQLRLKQRSYRPVSHIDDNFNKMSCNIKQTNAYV
uniref:Cysteine-rich motor neuron 1 protein n=1 Tax=Zeugodacus cucurbitae TaxID=28588 RepID=A0A0A1WME1_ZEUCU